MELKEGIKSALDGLLANRLRSFLSMLGIIIGIAAVVTIIAVSEGSQQMILANIQALGTNLITISAGRAGGASGSRWRQLTDIFTLKDAELIRTKASAVAGVAPVITSRLLLQYEDKNTNITVYGVTPEYEEILNFHVQAGRFVTEQDLPMIVGMEAPGFIVVCHLVIIADFMELTLKRIRCGRILLLMELTS